ncbi:MAG: hypothetical protein PUB68_08220 [Lachnospiraceae bacterium]|nr:hypothetical protein [Lachnospiraceae bacterium]
MAIYKIADLIEILNGYKHDGFEYAEISEFIPEPDDEDPTASLEISGFVDENETSTDYLDAVELPPNYVSRVQ